MTEPSLEVRVRVAAGDGSDRTELLRRPWDPARSAVVICDMWDAHHCVAAAARVAQMAPRVHDVVSCLRDSGSLIVHAPGGCMAFYSGTPARLRALRAPRPGAREAPIDWNGWDKDPHSTLPSSLTDPGPCSCDSAEPCGAGEPPYPWTRQAAAIAVLPNDAVSDDGGELQGLLESLEIRDVIVVGVHTNICILGRPYGIRQLVFSGRRPLLCRDLTDSFHRDPRGHSWGTDRVVEHIERNWCPTITSDQLAGGTPFTFSGHA